MIKICALVVSKIERGYCAISTRHQKTPSLTGPGEQNRCSGEVAAVIETIYALMRIDQPIQGRWDKGLSTGHCEVSQQARQCAEIGALGSPEANFN